MYVRNLIGQLEVHYILHIAQDATASGLWVTNRIIVYTSYNYSYVG